MSTSVAIDQNGLAAGKGGRSSVSGVVATVFGATGFFGRYVVNNLGRIGSQVIVPYRCQVSCPGVLDDRAGPPPARPGGRPAGPGAPPRLRRVLTQPYRAARAADAPRPPRSRPQENEMMHLKVMGDLGQIVPLKYSIRDEGAVRAAVEQSNVVINLVGADKETWNWRYKEVNVDFAARLARACADAPSVERLVHVSTLVAAADAPSRRSRSRFDGEQAAREAFPAATIVRLGDLVGPEDRFFNRMAALVKSMPRVLLPDGGLNMVQPVWVNDAARGMQRILEREDTAGKTFEFAGPRAYSMREVHDLVVDMMREPRHEALPVPVEIAAPIIGAVESAFHSNKLPSYMFNPWFTQDGMLDATADATRTPGSLGLEDLGVLPRLVTEGRPIEHVRFYRTGGYHMGETRMNDGV